MPLPNSRLIHSRFHDEIRRSAVGDLGLPDTCTITRIGAGPGTTDPVTGIFTPPAPTIVFEGSCRVQLDTLSQGRIVDVGDELITLHRYRAGIEWDAGLVLVNDVLTVHTSKDLQLIERPLVVRDFILDTFLVRRALVLEDHPTRP